MFSCLRGFVHAQAKFKASQSYASHSVKETRFWKRFTGHVAEEAKQGAASAPVLLSAHKAIGYWLLGCSGLVYATVVIGGVTRLTESGLSITEWNAIKGARWPANENEWNAEFMKYQQTPEYLRLNKGMSLSEFKSIYYWEWAHRNAGRVTGAAYALPTLYFLLTRPSGQRVSKLMATLRSPLQARLIKDAWMSPGMKKLAVGCTGLIGVQGALGWYMVKSGLDQELMQEDRVPRVNQLRLTAHLSTALALYIGTLGAGLKILRQHKQKNTVQPFFWPDAKRFAKLAHGTAGVLFVTAVSGALVAGLDAGLLYGTWPKMGTSFIPPTTELFPETLAKWKQPLENPVTVQLQHRLLAYTSIASVTALLIATRKKSVPKVIKRSAFALAGAVTAQAALGISTLVYMVPVPLAAAHQAGSLVVLSAATYMLGQLKAITPAKKPNATLAKPTTTMSPRDLPSLKMTK